MSRVTDIRRALAARLDGLDVKVTPAPAEYGQGAAMDSLTFAVLVTVGAICPEREAELDELLDPEHGVRALLEEDRQLGGLVADVSVVKSSGYLRLEGDLLGAAWTVACVV